MKVLILGATSAIAEATARLYATEGAELLLIARNSARLDTIAADLRLRGAARVETAAVDLVAGDPADAFPRLVDMLGGADHVLLAYGTMTDTAEAERNWPAARAMLEANFTSAAGWALAAADYLGRRRRGSLVVLGSPAGDRGRRVNYIYGAAKAGLATLVEGLAHRFRGEGPRFVVVKPGPTDTPMTAGLKKGGPLWATPDVVARAVRRAAEGGGQVQYVPARWALIMAIVRLIPARLFNRMNF